MGTQVSGECKQVAERIFVRIITRDIIHRRHCSRNTRESLFSKASRSIFKIFQTKTMGMNVFRIIGDVSHYAAIVTIFLKIVTSKSCKGISGKTQILYLLVFLTRYIDIFFNFISLYNTGIKIFFILSSLTNIYLVFIRYSGTISNDLDSFRIEILITGAAILSL